jgi:hypothetical protein
MEDNIPRQELMAGFGTKKGPGSGHMRQPAFSHVFLHFLQSLNVACRDAKGTNGCNSRRGIRLCLWDALLPILQMRMTLMF